jgi:concanavalin A-like lectin/glucanase superfamily protein
MRQKITILFVAIGLSSVLLGEMPRQGLVAWWKLNSNAVDSVGHLNGNTQNVTYVKEGKIGYAVFNGKTSVIKIKNDGRQFVKDRKITVSAWIKIQDGWNKRKNGCIIGLGGYWGGWRLVVAKNKVVKDLMITFRTGGQGNESRNKLAIYNKLIKHNDYIKLKYDKWTHVVFTWDGVWIKGYLDGEPIYRSHSDKPYTPKEKYWMGIGFNCQGVGYFKGGMRDICIWDKSLNELEIKEIYKTQKDSSCLLGKEVSKK